MLAEGEPDAWSDDHRGIPGRRCCSSQKHPGKAEHDPSPSLLRLDRRRNSVERAVLEPCLADFKPVEHHKKAVWIGCDLSQNKDITAVGFVVKTGEVEKGEHKGKPTFDAWVEVWTLGDTIAARELRDKQPYQLWAKDGHLNAPKGKSISYRHVAQAIAEADHEFDIQCLAYDRYSFKRGLEPECNELGLSIEFVEHPQGGTKKGKPTPAMIEAAEAADREPEGLWMPMSVRQTEELLLEKRIRIKRKGQARHP